jgi:ribosomal protein L33
MAIERYCQRCGEHVKCRAEHREHSTTLFCPKCNKRIATLFGEIKMS